MFISVAINFVNELRQGAAAGCALYALRGRAGGWHRQAMVGLHNRLRGAQQARSAPGRQGAAAGCALYALRGRAGGWHRQAMVGLHNHLRGAQLRPQCPCTRRTTSAVSAANECEGITCLWQVTRNDSDEAERRERSPSGVVSAANGEELAGAARQVRPARAAREWKCLASQR